MQVSETKTYTAGSVNTRKLIKQLGNFDGSNYLDLLKELIDNSFDAEARNIKISIDSTNNIIFIEDDGNGMEREEIIKFTELYSESSNQDRSVDGKFGIGAKKACAVLSNLGKVILTTVKNNIKSLFSSSNN